MSAPSALAATQPLTQEQSLLLARLTESLDGTGLWWLSGYAAGLARGRLVPAAQPATAPEFRTDPRLTVLYGSQTGNARRVAEALGARLGGAGLPVRVLRADAYVPRELKDERALYVVVSTQGDGEPPDDARGLFDFLGSKRAPALGGLKYAVLGLGDSSYPQFCEAGRWFDARLAELGATRLAERADADLDVDSVADPWQARVFELAREANKAGAAPLASVTPLRPLAGSTVSRNAPHAAELLANQRITGRGSDRDICHLELSLAGAGLHYEPGDALGVWPTNPAALVAALLDTLALDGEQRVEHAGTQLPLREWLGSKREITRLSRPFVATHAVHAGSEALDRVLAPDQASTLAQLLAQQQLIDLLRAHPGRWSAGELVAALRPLAPRLYSIASSRKVVGDEAHLTVAHVEYAHGQETRWGAASHFLSAAGEGQPIPVFVEPNERFRLPQDAARDVIMIGPGTGVAPFRGFVQEREATGASGRNWLLFGNPHSRSDFLYQLEWQEALKRGSLHRLDLAFSRDQADKVYVQHRLREHGRTLYDWLQDGAHLYVCGATAMGKDVHAALLDVIAREGGKSAEDAAAELATVQAQGRYARDVY
jgi:sulfite reductase (NADPH) flavoprotein alpha-component